MMRLFLASVVAVAHSISISRGWQPVVGETQVGAMAVDAFFIVSGFLVTMSFLRLASMRRYTWHRFLRIAPGFYACLIVTAFFVAPLASLLRGGSITEVYQGPNSALDYLTNNALLLIRQFTIDTLPGPAIDENVINGALWTLFYEALCYGMVAVLGVFAVLRRRTWVVGALLILLQLITIFHEAGWRIVAQENLPRLVFVFLLGAAAHLFAANIPIRGRWALLSGVVLLFGLLMFDDYRTVGALPFAYLVLYAVIRVPLRQNPARDLSYGMYIYHWPLTVLLVSAGLGALPLPLVVLSTLLVSTVAATASWHLVEGPALRWKSAAWVTRPLGRSSRHTS